MPSAARYSSQRRVAMLALLALALSCGSEADVPATPDARALAPGAPGSPGSAGSAESPRSIPATDEPGPSAPQRDEAEERRYAALAERLRAGAGKPAPLTEFATSAQRRAMEQAKLLLQQLSLAPDDAGTRVELARIYEQSMLPDRALQVLGPLFEEQPVPAEALFLAASCLHVRSELDDALVLLARVLATEPSHMGALQLGANLLRRLGRLEEACVLARRGLAVQPFHAGLQIPLALAAWEGGDLIEAERRLDLAAENDPELLEARYLRARLWRELGRDAEAEAEEAAHARLVRLDDLGLPPGLPEPQRLLALARSYRQTGELERAAAELSSVLAAARNAEATALLTEIWSELGIDVEAALAELRARHPHLAGDG